MKQDDVSHFEALKAKQRAKYLPKISEGANVLHLTDVQGIDLPVGALGSTPFGAIPAQTLRIDQGATNWFSSGTHLLQPTTELFAVHAVNHAAAADLNISRLERDDTEIELAIDVRKRFYTIEVIAKRQEAADAAEQAANEKLREAAVNSREGASLGVGGLEDQATLLEQQQQVLKLRLAVHQDLLQLADLLGAPLNTHFVLLDSPNAPSFSLPTRSQARDLALRQQPKVRSAEQAVEKAHADLRAAEDGYIPNLDVIANYEYDSGVPFLARNYGVFGAQLTYDLFDGGARQANVRDARAGLRKAETNLDQTREDATIRVEDAYDQMEQATLDVTAAESALKARTEAARLAENDFTNGASLAAARDQARAGLLSAEASMLEAHDEFTLAQNEIRRVLGQLAE